MTGGRTNRGGILAAPLFEGGFQMAYLVISWTTDEILSEHKTLAIAKRHARGEGHTGEDDPLLTGYPPRAFVSDGTKFNGVYVCVYNPRFAKQICAAVGSLINAQSSDSF
jgi:hypothetical protein